MASKMSSSDYAYILKRFVRLKHYLFSVIDRKMMSFKRNQITFYGDHL